MFSGLLLAVLLQLSASRLAFTHDGANTTRYELKIDTGPPVIVVATPFPNVPGDFTVPLPPLPAGVHTITLSACNVEACAPGSLIVGIPKAPSIFRLVINATATMTATIEVDKN